MPRVLSPLNAAEVRWLSTNLARLAALAPDAGLEPGELPTLEQLDAAFGPWMAATRAGATDPNPGINAFGTALGEHFVRGLRFDWVVAADDDGTEMAVVRQPGEVLVYPPNLVAKRYVAGTERFFVDVYAKTAHALALFEPPPAAPARPWWKFWG